MTYHLRDTGTNAYTFRKFFHKLKNALNEAITLSFLRAEAANAAYSASMAKRARRRRRCRLEEESRGTPTIRMLVVTSLFRLPPTATSRLLSLNNSSKSLTDMNLTVNILALSDPDPD
jgi:hypothetical protein